MGAASGVYSSVINDGIITYPSSSCSGAGACLDFDLTLSAKGTYTYYFEATFEGVSDSGKSNQCNCRV